MDSTCKVCEAGYSLKNNTCQKCVDENCKSCNTALDVCDAEGCLDGYIFGNKKKKIVFHALLVAKVAELQIFQHVLDVTADIMLL